MDNHAVPVIGLDCMGLGFGRDSAADGGDAFKTTLTKAAARGPSASTKENWDG
jgi:hypothetical protein